MANKRISFIAALLLSGLLLASCGAGKRPDNSFFKMRGIVVAWDDVKDSTAIDWIRIMKESGLNTISVFGNEDGDDYKAFKEKCIIEGIDFEYEDHAMSSLLPRNLFSEHPEYFRMDENGNRVADGNGCPSSKEGLEVIMSNVARFASKRAPSNHKYYTWLFDGGDICHCPDCKGLGTSDQGLLFENHIIKALKQVDPDAQLAHLAYHNSTEAPKVIKPEAGIFLEFAPFFRRWDKPLSDTTAVSDRTPYGWGHKDYLRMLKDNLAVFPAETAQVLEYWLDVSLVSDWKKPQKQLTFHKDVFEQDLKTYAELGIRNITCYGAWIDAYYARTYGDISFISEYGEGLRDFTGK